MWGFLNRNKEDKILHNINFKITALMIEWRGKRFQLNRVPGTCPYCQSKTHWEGVWLEENNKGLSVILRCSDITCHSISLFIYEKKPLCTSFNSDTINYHYCLIAAYPKEIFQEKKFSDLIEKISPEFIQLYHQAERAEIQSNTEKISGIGFRKALEFLIKDYLISENKEQADDIKKPNLTLGQAVENYCQDDNFKKLLNASVYLGNDEAHYIRRWEEYDVNNLKELINLVVQRIEDKIKTDNYCQNIKKTKKDE